MITASKMREITKNYYNSPNLRARARRIGLEHQIKKAASEGYYSIEVPHMDDINIEYFRAQGFEVTWQNSCFLLAAGHWNISWSDDVC